MSHAERQMLVNTLKKTEERLSEVVWDVIIVEVCSQAVGSPLEKGDLVEYILVVQM